MTDTPITLEAVERLAAIVERHQGRKAKAHKANPRYAAPDDRYAQIPDTLRALRAALTKAETRVLDLVLEALQAHSQSADAMDRQHKAEAERDEACASVAAVVEENERLRAFVNKVADGDPKDYSDNMIEARAMMEGE
jgi:multidrug efflux pump subunit AcrA (membrane-fusion protein)